MVAHFELNHSPHTKVWSLSKVLNVTGARQHVLQDPQFGSTAVDQWWMTVRGMNPVDWMPILSTLLYNTDVPFIGEVSGQLPAINRRLAELHDMRLKTEIYKAGKQNPGLRAGITDAKAERRLLNTLRRCFTHRLTYMIVNFSEVARHLDNAEMALNLELSVFEFIEKQVNDGRFDTNLKMLLIHESGLPPSEMPDVGPIKQMFDVLRCVREISLRFTSASARELVHYSIPTDATIITDLLSLMNPLDVLYTGPLNFDSTCEQPQLQDFPIRLQHLLPKYYTHREASTDRSNKRMRNTHVQDEAIIVEQ